jgi:phosphoribosylformylglycinamidine (FGAM) synthase-like enzyme
LTEESAEQQRGRCRWAIRSWKSCCEACLELLATGAVAGIQDMGAAGLTCSTCETAARAGTGIEIELDKVPQRAPEHDSLRNHAERIAGAHAHHRHKGREEEVKRIFDKWDLPWAEVGTVTDTGTWWCVTAEKSWWTFPRKKSPTNRRFISASRRSRNI